MLFGSNPTISELIIDTLAEGPFDSLLLLKIIQNKTGITKQGFYRSLRDLQAEEVVTKNKRTVLLSPVWASKVEDFSTRLLSSTHKHGSEMLFNLSEGDSMTFRFRSIIDLYLLWTHYFYIFIKQTSGPILFYNSHNPWSLIRSDIENEMYSWISDHKRQAYMVIGHNTALDKSTTRYIIDTYGIELAYENEPTQKVNFFPVVFGDYVMTTILDLDSVSKIDEIYKSHSEWNDMVEAEFKRIISSISQSKVVILRKKKKAEQLRKKLLNHFIFYK